MDGATLARAFERNLRVVEMQTDGLTHEDSLTQHPYNVNCLNWVLGHVAQNRDVVLGVLGVDEVLSERRRDRYARESDPVTGDGPDVVRLDELLAVVQTQQRRLDESLAPLTPDELAAPHVWGDAEMSLLRRVHFHYFHETYHVGQTDLLRQMSGKSDAVL
ncbi:MAG: DinB family protein [Acidimicrobiia bacterium]|nr:DinB family protein [Acidimicrobiia bacterium]